MTRKPNKHKISDAQQSAVASAQPAAAPSEQLTTAARKGQHGQARVDDSKPEPDIALLRPRDDYYSEGTPQPSDILLVIEVADSSLDFDRDTKVALYAEAGIPEYWIVNLIDNCVEVHRGPKADGSYADCQRVSKGGAISLLGEEIAVDQFL